MPNSIYALILAGGSGERFWPLSRRACPKQLLRLVSNKTLLEETLGRLEGVVPPDHTLILTNTDQESAVRKLLGGFPKENIIAEDRKSTRLNSSHRCISYAVFCLKKKNKTNYSICREI